MSFFSKVKALLDKPAAVDEELDMVADNAKTGAERRQRKRINAKEGSKVLIVDDSKTICTMLKKMMQQNQYLASTAETGEDGLKSALTEKPDLIFLDIVLPKMNGFEVLRKLRKNSVTKDIPVIMMSGNHQATEIFYASRIGADDFLKKPFSRYELFFRIEKMLDDEQNLIRKK